MSTITFTAVQLGPLDREEVKTALDVAAGTQRAFNYVMYPRRFPLNSTDYRLPNKGWDLDRAVRALVARHEFPRPAVFLASVPYSEWDSRRKPDWFYFSEFTLDGDPSVAIISTHLWSSLPGPRRLQPHVLSNLAAFALTYTTGAAFHIETHNCLFDYCYEPEDVDKGLAAGWLCDKCDRFIQRALRENRITVEQVAAVRRLLNRASDKRRAFVIMPFRPDFDRVFETIKCSLEADAWDVIRADDVCRPRRITDAILLEIHSADLVVAELTGGNPNVCWELGFAHAVGADVIMLTQEKTIPINMSVERVLMYRATRSGLADLGDRLRKMAA